MHTVNGYLIEPEAKLNEADLRGANLSRVNLNGALLNGASLRGANLKGASLRGADLSGADLSGALLNGADLSGTFLNGTFLNGACLSGASLSVAYLSGASLRGAYLPSPTVVLMAHWGFVSDELCLELMRYDADNHPDPNLFNIWKDTGVCPYAHVRVGRAAYFVEKRGLWSPGGALSAYKLMCMVLKEKTVDWSE